MNVFNHVTRIAMSYIRLPALVACFFLFVVLCVGALQSSADDEFKVVIVKKGHSVSYLSFKLYKKYNKMIADSIRSCNPALKNINLIYVGQKLRFPRLTHIEQGKYLSKKEVKVTKERPRAALQDEVQKKNIVQMEAYITYLTGDVEILRRDTTDWQPARTNQKLFEGDRIRVNKNSMAELITEKKSVIRLSGNSALEITKLAKDPVRKTETSRFALSLGRLWNKVRKLISPKSEYSISTPVAISGVRGTVYSIDILPNNDTRFKTYSGSINVWNPSKLATTDDMILPQKVPGPIPVPGPHPVGMKEWTSIILKKREGVLITKEGLLSKETFDPLKARDDAWVKWNVERAGK